MESLNAHFRAACMILSALTLSAQGSRSVALVAECAGRITWEEGGALSLFQDIPAQKNLLLSKDARLTVLTLKSGEELVFQGPSRLRFSALGIPEGSQPRERRKVPAPLQGALSFKPGTLAQAGVAMREVSSERFRVEEEPPSVILGPGHCFQWRGAGAGVSYRLRVQDTLGEPLFQRETLETSMPMPEGLSLAENETYTWTVETLMKGSRIWTQSGRFALLPKSQREQLAQARPGPGASFAQRLLFAAMLEQFKLHAEAKTQWKALAQERPEDPVLQDLASEPSESRRAKPREADPFR